MDRRTQILEAAVAVFAEHGQGDARVRDVADRAGVAYGLVYHYFGSREALLEAVVDDAWSAFAEALEGIAASPRPPRARLSATIDYVFSAWEAWPERMAVLIVAWGRSKRLGEALARPPIARALQTVRTIAADAQAAGALPALSPDAYVLLFFGALEAALARAVDPDDGPLPASVDDLRAALTTLFLPEA